MELLSQVSPAGWIFFVVVVAALTQLPGYVREVYRESRKPRKHVPGEDPPIFYGPKDHGDGS